MTTTRLYGVVMTLTVLTFAVAVAGTLNTGSLGLYSDALHLIADNIPLVLGYRAARAREHGEHTERQERQVTLSNIATLIVVGVWIVWETIARAEAPVPVESSMLWFASCACVGQGLQYRFARHIKHTHSHTGFGQRLHLLCDWAAEGAVLLGAIALRYTGSSAWDTAASGIVALASFGAAAFLWYELQNEKHRHHTH